jgi:CRP-like cAMP-binding protein
MGSQNNDELKQLLFEQTGGKMMMSNELFDRFLGSMTEISLKNREILIPYGKRDHSLYVQRNGILRACYFNGENEKTYGFTNPGTVTFSYHSLFINKPSAFQFESCGETDMLRLSKKDMDHLLDSSWEFTRWLLTIHEAQCYFNEFKHVIINGTAKERYLSLIEKRPDILARVPLKIIASYLGVTPVHLSRLKK